MTEQPVAPVWRDNAPVGSTPSTTTPEYEQLLIRGEIHPTKPDDLAQALLLDNYTSTPNLEIYRETCYICVDPEFAAMGLPLCSPCPVCKGHTPADDVICENGHDISECEYDV